VVIELEEVESDVVAKFVDFVNKTLGFQNF